MLIGVLTCLIIISYCIRNRPILLKSFFLANFKKTHFKFVSNNIQDQIIELLFWNSFIITIVIFFSYLTDKKVIYKTPLFLCFSSIIKKSNYFFSEKIFQINLNLTYFTSFIIMVIHLGWVTIPLLLLKTTYYSWLSTKSNQLGK